MTARAHVADSSRWQFSPANQRYYSPSGRMVSPSTVNRSFEAIPSDHRKDLRRAAERVSGGSITPRQFQETLRDATRRMHLQSRALGVGGQEFMASRDFGAVGGHLKREYRYLADFGESIARGELRATEISRRASLYGEAAARRTYQDARLQGHEEAGFGEKRRELASGNPCLGCAGEASAGWVPIGSLSVTEIGSQDCDGSDKCQLGFRFSAEHTLPPRRAMAEAVA